MRRDVRALTAPPRYIGSLQKCTVLKSELPAGDCLGRGNGNGEAEEIRRFQDRVNPYPSTLLEGVLGYLAHEKPPHPSNLQ